MLVSICVLVMATFRGSVIGRDDKLSKLIIRVHDGGVVSIDRPADLDIETGAAVDIQKDGTLIYPVASSSTNQDSEDSASKKMRMRNSCRT